MLLLLVEAIFLSSLRLEVVLVRGLSVVIEAVTFAFAGVMAGNEAVVCRGQGPEGLVPPLRWVGLGRTGGLVWGSGGGGGGGSSCGAAARVRLEIF